MRWDLPLRLLAGMHYLALSEVVNPWSDPAGFVEERLPWLARFVSEQEVQTNEVLRSWALLPAFLTVARKARLPLALVELGSSAGLNLVWDRYRYRYEAGEWGPLRADFVLAGEEHRPVPADLLRTEVSVVRRVGIDRSPIDVTTEGRALLLQSFVWADQIERVERLRWAIADLRLDPPELVRGDFVDLLPEDLAPLLACMNRSLDAWHYLLPPEQLLDGAGVARGQRGVLAKAPLPLGRLLLQDVALHRPAPEQLAPRRQLEPLLRSAVCLLLWHLCLRLPRSSSGPAP